MTDPTDPDRSGDAQLDAAIRRLIADAGADAPPPDSSTFRMGAPTASPERRSPSRWVTGAAIGLAAAAIVGLVIVAVDDDPDDAVRPADSTMPASSLPDVPVTTAPPMTSPASAEPSTTAASTTAVPIPVPITRPIVDPVVCTPTNAREGAVQGISLFARSSSNPIPIQVIGDPIAGPTGSFALVQRYFGDGYTATGDELVEIDGFDVWISTFDNGNGVVTWDLGDGSQGYIRSRGLTRDELVAIVDGLTPRLADHPLPGFDYVPVSDTLTLLHEQMNTDITGTVARSGCRVEATGYVYRISAIDGDPVFEYGGVIDRPPPLEVGVRDGVLIVLDGLDDPTAPTVDDVIDADPDSWLELRSRPEWPEAGEQRVESIGEGFDVVVPLVPADSSTPTSYLTLRLVREDGVASLEVYTADAVLAEDAAFWQTEITPGGGGISTASPETIGSVKGFRLGDAPPGEPIEVTISIIDGGGFVLQSTGPVQLIPQS